MQMDLKTVQFYFYSHPLIQHAQKIITLLMQSVAIFSLLLLVCTSTCISVQTENTTCIGNYCPSAINNSTNGTNATILMATSGSQPILTANMDNTTNMNNMSSNTNTTTLTATSGSQPILTANMDSMNNLTSMSNMTGTTLSAVSNSTSNTNATTLTATSGSQPILTANMGNISNITNLNNMPNNMNNMTNNTMNPSMAGATSGSTYTMNIEEASSKVNNEARATLNELFHSGCFSDDDCEHKIGQFSNPFACKHKGGKSWRLNSHSKCMKLNKL